MRYNTNRLLVVLLALIVAGFLPSGRAHAASATTLYSFCSEFQSPSCLDGEAPRSRLLQVGDEFYGTTATGGLAKYQYSALAKAAYGTLFRVSPTGAFTQLYDFCQQTDCADGAGPGNYLTHGPSGEIYGVTLGG